MRLTEQQLRNTIRRVITELAIDPMVPLLDVLGVAAPEEEDEIVYDMMLPVDEYPDVHTSEDGRMFDYGNVKSDSQEGRMSKAKLFRMGRWSQSLGDRLEEGDELPGWVQDKITTAEDRLRSAYEYMDYKLHRMKQDGKFMCEVDIRRMARNILRS